MVGSTVDTCTRTNKRSHTNARFLNIIHHKRDPRDFGHRNISIWTKVKLLRCNSCHRIRGDFTNLQEHSFKTQASSCTSVAKIKTCSSQEMSASFLERNFKTSESNCQSRQILQKFGFQAKEEEWKHKAKEIKGQKCFLCYRKVGKRDTVEKMIL